MANGKQKNIYREGDQVKDLPCFKTEDTGKEDVRFDWEQLKISRVLSLSEQAAIRDRLKIKAAFSDKEYD